MHAHNQFLWFFYIWPDQRSKKRLSNFTFSFHPILAQIWSTHFIDLRSLATRTDLCSKVLDFVTAIIRDTWPSLAKMLIAIVVFDIYALSLIQFFIHLQTNRNSSWLYWTLIVYCLTRNTTLFKCVNLIKLFTSAYPCIKLAYVSFLNQCFVCLISFVWTIKFLWNWELMSYNNLGFSIYAVTHAWFL
jgi:hypothetical protein